MGTPTLKKTEIENDRDIVLIDDTHHVMEKVDLIALDNITMINFVVSLF